MLHLLVLAAILAPALSAKLPYIVGGNDVAYAGKYPWQASLQYFNSHTCGASLISDRWLVCASHCVGRTASYYSVILGLHDRSTQRQGKPTNYNIQQIIMHPQYESNGYKGFPNDISLIKLSSTVDMSNSFVAKIDLPYQGQTFSGNSECMISGWGAIYGGSSLPNILKEASVDVYSDSYCRSYLSNAGPWHTCVGRKGSNGACQGDSGGPLACKVNGQWKLAGAASFVFGSCSVNSPTFYASVGNFVDWIQSTTGGV